MRKIWHIGITDLKLIVKDKMFFFWSLLFPMIFIYIFGSLFTAGRTDTKSALMVLNKDKGQWGAYLIEKIDAPGIELKKVDAIPKDYIRFVIIPENFSQNIEAFKSQSITLMQKSDSNLKAGRMAETKIMQSIIKLITEMIIKGEKDIKTFFDKKPEFRSMVEIKTRFPDKTITKIPSGFDHTIPGILVQFIMIMVLVSGGIIVMEDRKRGILSRVLFSSASYLELLGGKFFGRLLMGLLQSLILIIVGMIMFHLNLGNFLYSFLNILIFSACMACLSIFIGSVLNSEEVIVGVAILTGNIFAALGGSWWPMEVVPDTFKIVGMISPSYWAMKTFHQVIFFKEGFSEILINFVVLSVFFLVFMFLAVRYFKIRD